VLSSARHDEDFYRAMWNSIERTGSWRGEIWNKRKNGEIFPELLAITSVPDSRGNITHYVGSFFDITERHRTETALKESEQRFRTLIEWSPEPVMVVRAGVLAYANPVALLLLGARSAQELIGKPILEIVHPDFHQVVQERMRILEEGAAAVPMVEEKLIKLDGTLIDVEAQSAAIVYDGMPAIQVAIRDITARKAAQEQIQTLAFSDALTKLPNRRLFMDRLEQALTASRRHQREGALLFVDLDDFKTINDTLGHDQGDVLLQQVAQRLLTCVREGDTVARVGGDEFVVLLKELSQDPHESATWAEAIAKKILAALNEAHQLDHAEQHCTASIGVTMFGRDQRESIDEPLRRADMAMYQAKTAGRNTLRFFDPKMQAVVSSRAALEAGLHEALDQGRFLLHYQAQVTHQGQITGVEALLRWNDPRRGMVPPAEFISLAEQNGLILPLGKWVLESACRQLAQWATEPAMAQLTIAVNVSARQFHQSDFVELVLAALDQSGANASRLKLELTESLLIKNVEDVIAKMTALKACGVGFSLDDFGTGYSSLSYLKRLPLDQLKIDQGFVRDILSDANDAAIAKMVIALSESLGLSVIAEGVETAAQREFLLKLGCNAFQGYLFSRPLSLPDFEDFFQNGSRP
jgi:diguanylate cyclase (GGDEF)-like protein/PAS domain S-box-containing protein